MKETKVSLDTEYGWSKYVLKYLFRHQKYFDHLDSHSAAIMTDILCVLIAG